MTARRRILPGLLLLLVARCALLAQADDRLICNKIFSYSFEHALIQKPAGDVIAEIGRQFLGSPYEAGTLDRQTDEGLVVNLRSFDCVTFVENVLALARCVKSNQLSFEAYRNELRRIRYRNGAIDGYPSRLHYFSEWVFDNQKKGIVGDSTERLGGTPYRKKINFMTTHRESYPKLAPDSAFRRMAAVEKSITALERYFIPKSRIASIEREIQSGDIIAITTSRKGLDVSHVGIAVRLKDGSLHYMHAPDVKGAVKISEETLSEHLQGHPAQTGIIVVRSN